MKLFSSAYNTWPADNEGRLAFVTELAERDWVGGLELGYADSLAWPAGAPADLPQDAFPSAISLLVPQITAVRVTWSNAAIDKPALNAVNAIRAITGTVLTVDCGYTIW